MALAIMNERGLYFSQTINNHFTKNVLDATKFAERIKANNAVRNMPKILKKYNWQIVEVEDDPIPDININLLNEELTTEVTLEEMLNKVSHIESFTLQLSNRLLFLRTQLSIADMERVDLEHKIEFESSNASQGYRLYKLMHDTLNKRRKAKNEIDRINIILNGTMLGASKGEISEQLLALQGKVYTPRVLKELFE